MFAPYRDQRKVSIFGSARTTDGRSAVRPGATTRRTRSPTTAGWWSPEPGRGSCRPAWRAPAGERSIGVSIRLPFETGANSVIAGDAKHVSMKYFFTRKLMLVKESQAFVCLPGGFGTLDETFELLTLTQTGKGMPVPIVLLDAPGRPVLGVGRHVRARHARSPVGSSPPGHRAVHDHRLAARPPPR